MHVSTHVLHVHGFVCGVFVSVCVLCVHTYDVYVHMCVCIPRGSVTWGEGETAAGERA